MQIVISPSNKTDKKYEARIDGKNQYTSEVKVCQTLPYTKTQNARKDIYRDIEEWAKIGQIP